VGAISVRAVAHQQSNPVLVAPNRFDVQVTQPNHPPGGEIDRTWVTDTAAFFNAHPHRKFLIARHTRAAISESEAIEEARMSAAAMLVPNIGVIPNRGPQEYLVFVDQLTVDRVVERTERPYGDIWSAALLLDVSPERIHPVQVAMQDQRMSRASSTRWTIIASIALFAVMWLLYLALNAITRGYYAWRLRTAVFVFLIGGIVLLTMMAQWS